MADVSVRPAAPADAEELARIQIQTWTLSYATVLPTEVLAGLDPVAIAATWRAAITGPPTQRHHVLVALDGAALVGFTAFGPDADAQPADPEPDATAAITLLLVEPRWGRRGHGSRLLSAIADTAGDDGVTRLVTWTPIVDTASLEFYRSAGWEADGLQRGLDTGSATITELRLHASL